MSCLGELLVLSEPHTGIACVSCMEELFMKVGYVSRLKELST